MTEKEFMDFLRELYVKDHINGYTNAETFYLYLDELAVELSFSISILEDE